MIFLIKIKFRNCCNHNAILCSCMTHHGVCNKGNKTAPQELFNLSEHLHLARNPNPVFLWGSLGSVFNVLYITLYIIVCSFVFFILGIILYVIPPFTTSCYPFIIYFVHYIVCHSSIYDFLLPFYYLFWALYCMSFLHLRLLTTLLLSSKFFSWEQFPG